MNARFLVRWFCVQTVLSTRYIYETFSNEFSDSYQKERFNAIFIESKLVAFHIRLLKKVILRTECFLS